MVKCHIHGCSNTAEDPSEFITEGIWTLCPSCHARSKMTPGTRVVTTERVLVLLTGADLLSNSTKKSGRIPKGCTGTVLDELCDDIPVLFDNPHVGRMEVPSTSLRKLSQMEQLAVASLTVEEIIERDRQRELDRLAWETRFSLFPEGIYIPTLPRVKPKGPSMQEQADEILGRLIKAVLRGDYDDDSDDF